MQIFQKTAPIQVFDLHKGLVLKAVWYNKSFEAPTFWQRNQSHLHTKIRWCTLWDEVSRAWYIKRKLFSMVRQTNWNLQRHKLNSHVLKQRQSGIKVSGLCQPTFLMVACSLMGALLSTAGCKKRAKEKSKLYKVKCLPGFTFNLNFLSYSIRFKKCL